MSKIYARSPFIIHETDASLSYIEVSLSVWTGAISSVPTESDYSLRADAINREATIDVSNILKGYVNDVFDGTYSIEFPWCRITTTKYDQAGSVIGSVDDNIYSLTEGFDYFDETKVNDAFLLSSDVIVAESSSPVRVPVFTKGVTALDIEVEFLHQGSGQSFVTVSPSNNSSNVVSYVSSTGDIDTVKVTYPDNSFNTVSKTYKVKQVDSCDHTPYKVTFKNSHGVWEDVWFFNSSSLSLSTSSKSYNSHVLSAGTHNINKHQYTTISKNGRKRIEMNTGFYPEESNRTFEELHLSEQVYITYDNKVLPVQIKDGDFTYKTQLNEKLINYSVVLEFAFDVINTIR